MRTIRRIILSAGIAAAVTGTATAQQTGAGNAGGNVTSATVSPGGAVTQTTTAGNTTGNTGTTGTTGNTNAQSTATAPELQFNSTSSLDTSIGSQITMGNVNQSNIMGRFYANPYYQGRAGAVAGELPGGFGNTLYTATGTAGATGARTTAAAGGRAGAAAFGTTGNLTNASTNAQILTLPRQIAYTAVLKFPTPQLTPAKIHTEARAVIDRSTMISNPAGVEVIGSGSQVTIRGNVASEDESRLIEGMVRLTPGVRDVKNELRYPAAPQP